MQRRALTCLLVVPVLVGLMTGCGQKAKKEAEARTQLQQQLTTIQTLWSHLRDSRDKVKTMNATLDELKATPERKLDADQKQQLATLPDEVSKAVEANSTAYDQVQEKLAAFLTKALNDHPDAPETAEGLKIYSEEAIFTAEDAVVKAGDYKKALDILQTAKTYYDSIGIHPYQTLVDKMAELEDMRYLTKERFDLVTKGMTEDEVAKVAGVPYYLNKKHERGIDFWLYPRREGGAAAIYFNKSHKVYNKNFDAVKPRVATD
jgi:hypothetical protein